MVERKGMSLPYLFLTLHALKRLADFKNLVLHQEILVRRMCLFLIPFMYIMVVCMGSQDRDRTADIITFKVIVTKTLRSDNENFTFQT